MKNLNLPKPLTAQDKSSFAYKTVKDRLPVILVKIIDFLHRLNTTGMDQYAEFVDDKSKLSDAIKETTDVIGKLAKLRQELETNKPLETFIDHKDPSIHDPYVDIDLDLWNEYIMKHCQPDGSMPQWFASPWLLVECFMYRKIKEALSQTHHLKRFDVFCEQKRDACRSTISQIIIIGKYVDGLESQLHSIDQRHQHGQVLSTMSDSSLFAMFIQLSLWANRCDLSLSGMSVSSMSSVKYGNNLMSSLSQLKDKILCDNTSQAWECFAALRDRLRKQALTESTTQTNNSNQSASPTRSAQREIFIDIVADNSGYELFVDLCLMHCLDLLINSYLPLSQETDDSSSTTQTTTTMPSQTKVKLIQRLHVKRMPWFVSDTQAHDVIWLLNEMARSSEPALQRLASRWRGNLSHDLWRVHDHMFWTLPHDYAAMPNTCPDLYAQLRGSSFLVFKGDLNYRKLTGDLQWNILTPFKDSLRSFLPAPLMALRACKAHVVVGIEDMEIYAKINNNQLPPDWMISGEYALIQMARP